MITSISHAGSYLRPAQTPPSRTILTPADALPVPDADAGKAAANAKQGFPVSELKKLDMSGLKVTSVADHPELRDRMATMWLNMQATRSRLATEVPDNAPQNIYATVKVNGKVVATLYNGGSSAMTNAAAGAVGDLQDPPGLNGGPDLAQSRAERIAKALGGTIEKAPTAITQSEWKPRPDVSRDYTRSQLDQAFQAMMAEGQRAAAQRLAGYSTTPQPAGSYADFNT
jgi:capsid protein